MHQALWSRARILLAAGWLGLVALSLRPSATLERALDLAFLPSRALSELSAPLAWMRAKEARAARARLEAGLESARESAQTLLADEQDAALPRAAELVHGRRFLHGEVVRRGARGLDQIVVRLASLAGVEPGMPVASGEHYVGRVLRLEPGGAPEVTVALVTGASSFVGAELVDRAAASSHAPSVSLVVGGLAPALPGAEASLELAVRAPSRSPVGGGEVRVREPRFARAEDARWREDRFSELASGYRLGTLEILPLAGGGELLRVHPGLDYRGGLFRVVVIAPRTEGEELEQRLALDTFEAARWHPLRALGAGDLNARRAGRRFALPPGLAPEPGAAIAAGGRILGRVLRRSPRALDVRLCGDRGLTLFVLARVAGEARPRALGELVGLGRDRSRGTALFRWEARLPLEGEGEPVEAELFTGSGLAGVPRGLVLGSCALPRGAGPHLIELHLPPEASALERCELWLGASAPLAAGAP